MRTQVGIHVLLFEGAKEAGIFIPVMNSLSVGWFPIVVSCIILASCTKGTSTTGSNTGTTTDTTKTTTTDTTIYIAGSNGTNPVLWKNGIADTLSTTVGSASQVLLSGNDVYIAGVYQEIENFSSAGVLTGPVTGQYVYWKNGTQNNIGSFGNITYTSSMAVAGSNLYYADSALWENGPLIPLNGIALYSFAVGSDFYVAGYDSARDVAYWKNGQLNVVSPFLGYPNTTPFVHCLFVSGSDVYVGGMFYQAVYWKNGAINYLQYITNTSFASNPTSLLVSGNDVYATGHLINGSFNLGAAYWKNGIENDLQVNTPPNSNTTYFTTSIFLDGSDVYVAGYTSTFVPPYTAYPDSAVYWKNGVEKSLNSTGRANSIYVQKTTH